MLNVIPVVTTKKVSKKYTQKEIRRESKWFTTINQVEGKKKKAVCNGENKRQKKFKCFILKAKCQKPFLISHYFKLD